MQFSCSDKQVLEAVQSPELSSACKTCPNRAGKQLLGALGMVSPCHCSLLSSGDALPHGFLHLQRKLGWEHTFTCLVLGSGNEEGMSSMPCLSLTPLSPGAVPHEPELLGLKLAWLNPSHGSAGRCEQGFKPGLAERKELEICLLVLWFVLQQLIQDSSSCSLHCCWPVLHPELATVHLPGGVPSDKALPARPWSSSWFLQGENKINCSPFPA